jgi:hypothetical protein
VGVMIVASIFGLLGGCGMSQRRAELAYQRGDYRLAAQTYDELLREEPGNAKLKAGRADAVTKLHRVELKAVLRARQIGELEGIIRSLAIVLASRETWTPGATTLGDPQLDALLAVTTGWVRDALTAELRGNLRARRLHSSEQLIDRRSAQLPFGDFKELWPALDGELHTAAAELCSVSMPANAAEAPFLTSLLSSYCRAFDVPVPPSPSLDLASSVDVAVTIEGVSELQVRAAQGTVTEAFIESPWYDPSTPRRLRSLVSGTNEYRFTAREAQLDALWSERVFYQATETYQESYTDWEHYTQSVPHTVHRTESYSCGSYKDPRTCTRSVPSIEYRSESRTRPVTKYRTASRMVTKYRDEPRVHRYRATRRDGSYLARWLVQLELEAIPGATPFTFPERASLAQYGYDHDESFPAADVKPGRANLMTPEGWFDYVRRDLHDRLRDHLQQQWQTSFCQLPSYTLETAARCARGSAPPPGARAALSQLFGDETDLTLQRFTHWGARQPQAPATPRPSNP